MVITFPFVLAHENQSTLGAAVGLLSSQRTRLRVEL